MDDLLHLKQVELEPVIVDPSLARADWSLPGEVLADGVGRLRIVPLPDVARLDLLVRVEPGDLVVAIPSLNIEDHRLEAGHWNRSLWPRLVQTVLREAAYGCHLKSVVLYFS